MLVVYGTYEHVSGFRVKIVSTGVYVFALRSVKYEN